MSCIRVLRPAAHVRSLSENDGAVLLDLEKGVYLSLNGIGMELWTGIKQGLNPGQLRQNLCERYEISESQAQTDVEAFVAELRQRGLVHESDG